MNQKNYGRRYDAPFKEQAVKLLLSSGKSLHCVAQELGISDNALKGWKDAHLQEGGSAAELEIENQRLRRELERVTQQRDILKKSLGILSEDPLQKGMPK
jgi:transposase-like protein